MLGRAVVTRAVLMCYFIFSAGNSVFAAESDCAAAEASSSIGEWFERYPQNPLPLSQDSAQGVVHPDMLFFPNGFEGYKYWLFYTPYPPPGQENPYLARSNDGLHFSDSGFHNPLLVRTQPWEARHLADVDVVFANGMLYMYYMGCSSAGVACIGMASSPNGRDWLKNPANPILYPTQDWEASWVGAPAVYYDGGTFWMWFSGGYTTGIELASSTDGVNWTRENDGDPVLTGTPDEWDAGGISHPDVIFYKGKFWLYYWGFSATGTNHYRLGLATSVDKVHWVKSCHNPVLDTIPHSWEGYHIYRSSPVIIDDTMWLYYSAYTDIGNTVPRIGVAKSYSFLRGDSNGDDRITIGDAVCLVNYIFRNGCPPKPIQAGDANCDGTINVGDAIFIVGYLFRSGPAPCGQARE
jgi:predicted GH43/DUF377 family glycosyl hydrolase